MAINLLTVTKLVKFKYKKQRLKMCAFYLISTQWHPQPSSLPQFLVDLCFFGFQTNFLTKNSIAKVSEVKTNMF